MSLTSPLPLADPTAAPARSDLREVLVDGGLRRAHVHADLTPLLARQLNHTAVTAALDAHGVDHFVVRGMDDRTPVVGVSEDDRVAALGALEKLGAAEGCYVSQVLPKPPIAGSLRDAADPAAWVDVHLARAVKMTWFRIDPTGKLVAGPAYGCDVEFWKPDRKAAVLRAPRRNRMVPSVSMAGVPVVAGDHRFTRLASPAKPGRRFRTRQEFDHSLPDDIDFPIDVVYTWVDGADPEWQRRRATQKGEAFHAEAASDSRYINRDELKYSLRSLHLNVPWVRNIYIVTDRQCPPWLDLSAGNIFLVNHEEIFADRAALPTFNSCAIESQLHRIDGLAEHFLYLNDDMFFGRPLAPQTFFLANGHTKFFLSQNRIPVGPITGLDSPVDAMIKNNRRLIERRFGRTLTQGSQHVPYPLRRSILAEIEREFPAEHEATMWSRFRSPSDLTITYSLHHYYAFLTGRALPGHVNYGYVQLAVPDLAARLRRAEARRDWDTFCINDAYSTYEQLQQQISILEPFLEAYFPVPSPYESAGRP
ncbi:stealth family protein [Micromonospora krabiensis]|uniref:Stealth protein CR4, conserved region 4 n=1 Tax=Micromonospora krabiensis TaxID=307121 RepID=A0A1C3N3I2_9ACTN|nr:stealth family protein [Micromonospora krabiensis]SBV27125.1 Stealth protein CR4, conserved region 4 [Micromonospora krabiensis]